MADEFLRQIVEEQERLLRLLKEQIRLAMDQDADIQDIHRLHKAHESLRATISDTIMAMGGLR